MKFKVDFQFDKKAFRAEVERAKVEAFKRGVKEKVGKLRCPVHHKPPRIVVKGMKAEVEGCCEAMEALIRQEMG